MIKDNLNIFDNIEEDINNTLEFKKEIYGFIKDYNIKNIEHFIDDISEIYEVEITNNGLIIKDFDEEIYLSNKEIKEMMED